MFSPLLSIDIESVYNGLLPKRMAQCTPDMAAAIRNVGRALEQAGTKLVLSDLFRSRDAQQQAHNDYVSGKKTAYSPPPGASLHEAGRAFDLDLKYIKKLTLANFWTMASRDGLSPILASPDIALDEAWHFECRGSHKLVYDYYAQGHGDNFVKPYAAMAASAIVSIGQKVDALGDDILAGYIQSGLIRLGQIIGDLDGKLGPKSRTGLVALGIDPGLSMQSMAEFVDRKLQEAFPGEFFSSGAQHFALADAPLHLTDLSFPTAALTYQPDLDALGQLGDVASLLATAKRIDKQFVHPPRFVGLLPGGELYFDSNLELDTDGWPRGGDHGDGNWQAGTSLTYHDKAPLDANAVPYFVLPLPTTWAQQYGISLGDYAAVIYKDKLCFAVFGDLGPKNKLGEGSIELLRRLGKDRIRSDGSVINAGMGPGVITIVFPGSGAPSHRSDQQSLLAAIEQRGSALFAALGDQSHLKLVG